MVKKTKHGRVSNGSGWGRSSCDECDESTNGKEVILIYYPLEDHVERYDVTCFLKKNPRHRVRYEIVMAIMAVNGVPEAFRGNGCNLCEQSTEGEDVLVSYVQKREPVLENSLATSPALWAKTKCEVRLMYISVQDEKRFLPDKGPKQGPLFFGHR